MFLSSFYKSLSASSVTPSSFMRDGSQNCNTRAHRCVSAPKFYTTRKQLSVSAPSSMMLNTAGFFCSHTLIMTLHSYWYGLSNLLWAVNADFKFGIISHLQVIFPQIALTYLYPKLTCYYLVHPVTFGRVFPVCFAISSAVTAWKSFSPSTDWKIVVHSLQRDTNTDIECIGQLKQWMHLLAGSPKLIHLCCNSSQ